MNIRVNKGAFTLIELIIVVLIISIVYFVSLSSFSQKKELKSSKVELSTLKYYLKKEFDFTYNISFSCIKNDDLDCFIIKDDDYENMIKSKNIFSTIPTIYTYNLENSVIEFGQLKYENINYDKFFELKIDRDRKHKNMIVEVDNLNYYLIKNITNNILYFTSLFEINDIQTNLKREVQDAF